MLAVRNISCWLQRGTPCDFGEHDAREAAPIGPRLSASAAAPR